MKVEIKTKNLCGVPKYLVCVIEKSWKLRTTNDEHLLLYARIRPNATIRLITIVLTRRYYYRSFYFFHSSSARTYFMSCLVTVCKQSTRPKEALYRPGQKRVSTCGFIISLVRRLLVTRRQHNPPTLRAFIRLLPFARVTKYSSKIITVV